MNQNVAHLKTTSPFFEIFPSGIPITNILLPNQAICEGSTHDNRPEDVYFVDLDKLTPEQFEKLAAIVHNQCDPAIPFEIAKKEMKARGLPLRAKHVSCVSTDSRFFL